MSYGAFCCLAVKPVLFLCQSQPSGFHSLVPQMQGLVLRALCKPRAVLRIFPKMI